MRWRAGIADLWAMVPKGPVARGAAATFAVKLLAMPCTLLLQFGLVRLLKPSAYGEFMYAYTWYVSLLPLAALGLHEAAVRFVPEYRARQNGPAMRGFLRWSAGVTGTGALVTAGAAGLATWLLRYHLTPTLFVALLLAWACLPLGSLAQLASAALRAVDRFGAAQAPVQVVQPLLIVGITGTLALLSDRSPTGVTAMSAMVVSVGVVLGASTWMATRATGPFRGVTAQYRVQEWIDVAVHLLGLILIVVLWRVDVLMLGALRSTVEAGVYATAAQLQLLVGGALYALELVLAPTIARLHASGEIPKLRSILRLAARASAVVAVLAGVVLVVLGGWILRLFDPTFGAGYAALVILAGGQLYDVLTGPTGRLLAMTGHHRATLWLMAAAMAVNVTLNWLLIPGMGMLGAAVATAISLVLWKTVSVIYAWSVLGIDASVLGRGIEDRVPASS